MTPILIYEKSGSYIEKHFHSYVLILDFFYVNISFDGMLYKWHCKPLMSIHVYIKMNDVIHVKKVGANLIWEFQSKCTKFWLYSDVFISLFMNFI